MHTESEILVRKIRNWFDFISVTSILIGKDDEYKKQTNNNGKTHTNISDSVCKDLKEKQSWSVYDND